MTTRSPWCFLYNIVTSFPPYVHTVDCADYLVTNSRKFSIIGILSEGIVDQRYEERRHTTGGWTVVDLWTVRRRNWQLTYELLNSLMYNLIRIRIAELGLGTSYSPPPPPPPPHTHNTHTCTRKLWHTVNWGEGGLFHTLILMTTDCRISITFACI